MSFFKRLTRPPLKEWEKEYTEEGRIGKYRAPEKSVEVVEEPEEPEVPGGFRPYIPSRVRMRELSFFPLIIGTLLGVIFRSLFALSGPESRTYRKRFHPGRGHLNYAVSPGFKAGLPEYDNSGKQHCADRRVRRRIHRLWRWRHDAGDHDPRFRP